MRVAPHRVLIACAGLLTALTLTAFLPSLSNAFAPIDDEKNFLLNPSYRGLGFEQLRWMFSTNHMGHYIPVTWLTLGLDYLLFGLDPFGYHLTSLLFHVANGLLLLGLAWRLLPARAGSPGALALGACSAALAFAVHPLRVESVAWASERRDVVCGCFCLLALHAYVSAARATGRGRRRFLGLTLGAFTLALLSKGLALVLPLAFLALDVTLLQRLPPPGRAWLRPEQRAVLAEKLVFLAPALVSAGVTLLAIRYVMSSGDHVGFGARLAAAAYGLVFYVQKTIVPMPLPLIVHWQADVALATPRFAARGLLLLVAVVALVGARRRWPGLVAAALVYAAFVLPVSGLFQAGPQLVAQRYSYLSCLPWALVCGALVAEAAHTQARRQALWVLVLALSGVLVVATRSQAALWRDALTFCTRAAADAPGAWQPRYTLAALHLRAGRWAEAAREQRLALLANPAATPVINQAALLLATCPEAGVRNGREALVLAERLMRLTRGRDAWAGLALSAALAETGDYERARLAAQAASNDARRQGLVELQSRLAEALAAYARGRPLRMQAGDWGPEDAQS